MIIMMQLCEENITFVKTGEAPMTSMDRKATAFLTRNETMIFNNIYFLTYILTALISHTSGLDSIFLQQNKDVRSTNSDF